MRFFVIDLIKAVAAQLIVLHHLSAYGPVADSLHITFPDLGAWLYDYGRMAVQAFLVIGGYLAARTLGLAAQRQTALSELVAARYLRLALPFLAALVLTSLMAAIVRPWLSEDMVPGIPALAQTLAHVFLLHGVFGQASLTAGAWYVAIDFQLFVLLGLLMWRFRERALALQLLPVAALTLVSLFHFNLDSRLDDWAVYFFGAYGMGVLAWHIGARDRASGLLALLVCVVGLALWFDFRERIAVALGVTVMLVMCRRLSLGEGNLAARLAAYFGLNSYALFLVHFSLCLLANALFEMSQSTAPAAGVFMFVMTWLASNVLAHFFCQYVEMRSNRISVNSLLGFYFRPVQWLWRKVRA